MSDGSEAASMKLGSPEASSWRPLLPFVFALAAILLLFRDTAQAMVAIWLRSDTFAHCMLVPPISLWLAWRRRAHLAGLAPRPMPWLLLALLAACGLWLMGQLAAVDAASQIALVTLIVLAVPALYGWAITRELLFPLAFLYFGVPLGEFLVPVMIDRTADFTVAALRLTGIPVYREGNDFVIPSGNWSVVDACSGVRYLIASFMVGTLFAYLNYTSVKRRLAFMAVAIVVPIVANWVRAYLIVMIGHLSGNTLAVGVDHLIYGWVFFGVVIGLMFLIGMRWAQAEPPPAAATFRRRPSPGGSAPGQPWVLAALMLALFAGTRGVEWRLGQPADAAPPVLALPSGGVPGPMPFEPGFRNPGAQGSAAYLQDGRNVWLWVGHYRAEGEESRLVSSINTIVARDDKGWAEVSRRHVDAGLSGLDLAVRSGDVRQALPLAGGTPVRLRVWQFYWIDGRMTGGDARAKLLQAWSRLQGRGGDAAAVLVATPLVDDADADATLRTFLAVHGDAIAATLRAAQAGR